MKKRTTRKKVAAKRGRRKFSQKRNKLGQFASTKKRGKSAKRRR